MIEFFKFRAFRKRLLKAMETYHRLDDPWSAAHVQPVIESYLLAHGNEARSVLEVGSGDGVITHSLDRFATEIDCVEISPKAVAKAKKEQYGAQVSFITKDIHALSLTKEYDLVLLSFIIEYLGFDAFPKRFVWLLMKLTQNCKKIIIAQPIQGEENLKRVHRVVLILNQCGFIEEHKEINTDTSPDLFLGTYSKAPRK